MGGKKDMDITWDDVILNSSITKWAMEDFKKEGIAEGKREGKKEGKIEGKRETIVKVAKKLLKQGMTIEEVSNVTELSVAELKKLMGL